MDFPNLGTNPPLDDIMQRAREFNIEDNLLDLVMYGFTVVPPEKMGTSDLTPRLRDAILEVYERRSGHSIDNWKTYSGKTRCGRRPARAQRLCMDFLPQPPPRWPLSPLQRSPYHRYKGQSAPGRAQVYWES